MNREDFKENVKILLMLAGIFALIATPIAIAITVWHGSITWTLEEKEFSVWGSIDGTDELLEPWADSAGINIDPTTLPIIYTKDFYLQNDGTVEFTVGVTSTPTGLCSAEWTGDGMGSYVLTTDAISGARVLATLTLTITGEGSYDFQFSIV